MVDLNMYLASLLSMPRSISESDIVYTFLHCLIRDEQDLAKLRKGKQTSSLQYPSLVCVHSVCVCASWLL